MARPETATGTTDLTDHAATGVKFFVQASIDYPASLSHQAADIALKSRAANSPKPAVLLEAVKHDGTQIDKLVHAADRMHARRKKGPSAVSPAHVIEVLNKDFALAERMSVVPTRKLKRFLSTAPHGGFLRSVNAHDEVDKLIEKYEQPRKISRIWTKIITR